MEIAAKANSATDPLNARIAEIVVLQKL